MQQIHLVINGVSRKVYLKMEGANPTGSTKDRTGYALIQHLQNEGRLSRGSVIIESTSGNLGVALAYQCQIRGYHFVAVVDPKTTEENIAKMEAYGAQIESVHLPDANGGYLLSRLARVHALCAENDNYIWADQYSSPANPRIHYMTTGPEIYRQMNEKVDAIFAPVSTGGTLAGVGQFFREVSPSTRMVGVDAYGSVVFGAAPAARKLTGIGSSRPSSFLSQNLYDTHILVRDEEAFMFCRALDAALHIKVGGSSGATLAACARYLADHPTLKNVVCVCADTGYNYLKSIFNDKWIQEHNITLAEKHMYPVQKICK